LSLEVKEALDEMLAEFEREKKEKRVNKRVRAICSVSSYDGFSSICMQEREKYKLERF
jgi:hypothetical protein